MSILIYIFKYSKASLYAIIVSPKKRNNCLVEDFLNDQGDSYLNFFLNFYSKRQRAIFLEIVGSRHQML